MTSRNGRVIYCDGFAGPGQYSGGEPGSPLIAMQALHDHSFRRRIKAEVRFLFIEKDADRCNALQKNIDAYLSEVNQDYPVRVECGTFDDTLTAILDDINQGGTQLAPTLCFVDPFGVKGVSLNSLCRLMQNRSCELLITFMSGYLDRFLRQPEFESAANSLFGTDEWRESPSQDSRGRLTFLRELYQRQLEDVVGAKYVRYFTMLDKRKRPIYDLFFASTHPTGVDRMKEAMWKVDCSGTYQFNDATSPGQEVLLGRESVDMELVEMLFERFDGTSQMWRDVEESIRRSPYLVRKRIIKNYAKEHQEELTIKPEAGKRAGTLSDRALLRFHRRDG